MRLIGLFLLLSCFTLYAKSLTLNDWIKYFNQHNIQIIYSSDFLDSKTLNTLITFEESISELNSAIEPLSLTLVKVDDYTFVINPIQKTIKPRTGLIIHLYDTEKHSINSFSINHLATTNGLLLLNNLESNEIVLNINAEGYFPINSTVVPKQDHYTSLVFTLKPKPLNIDAITVTASQINFKSANSSKTSLFREDIENTVSLGNDPIRATQNIPGNASSGLSGKTRTRGGNENESLILLDNHILRDPFHFKNLFSLFSSINLSTVDGLDFYSGVFPIQYGGRLSSVLDIQTGDNLAKPRHEVGFDTINAYYTFRYNSDDYQQQYLASIRSGGYLINKQLIRDTIIQPQFDDAYFKATQQMNNNWSMSQHLLLSRDEIVIDDMDDVGSGEAAKSQQQDQDLWMQVNFNNHENMLATMQLYLTRKNNSRIGNISNENTIASLSENLETKNYGLKYDHRFNFRDSISLKFGFDVHQESTQISRMRNANHFGELVNLLNFQNQYQQNFVFANRGLAVDAFFNTRYQYNEKLIFDVGLRFEKKQWIDENVFSPRFNLSYFYDGSTTYRFALGRHQQSQYIDELLLEDETPAYFNPTSADIVVFEYNKIFSKKLKLRAEIYYKKYSSTQPYYENLFNGLRVLPDLFYDRIRVSPDDSQAKGIELTLSGSNNNFDWSSSYIYSDADDTIDSNEFPRSWDQHSSLKFNFHTVLSSKYLNDWNLDMTTNYHTGWARTKIIQENGEIYIGQRNQSTFKDFVQLDVKLSKTKDTENGQLTYAIQANNLLNTSNPCCVDYQINNGILTSKERRWLPITPNISIVYKWD